MNGGGARPASYSPPAGASSGIPGASYPVLGSAPVTNVQPRYGTPGEAQMRPAFQQRPLGGGVQQPMNQGQPVNNRPQQLAAALGQPAQMGMPPLGMR